MAVAPKQNSLEVLRKLVPLNTLSDEALDSLHKEAVFEKAGKGSILIEAGDTETQNVYLLSGQVALFSGKREVDVVVAGSDTARFPLAHQIPRKFTVKAKTKVEIVRLDNRHLGELLARSNGSDYEVSELDAVEDGDWMSQLLQSRVFQQIPAANIQGVMMRMEEQEALAGEVVIQQGEEGDFFYLINKGRCGVLVSEEPGQDPVEVAQLGPGDSFGEEALLSDQPRGSTVVMLMDGMLLRLSKDDFIQFVKSPLANEIDHGQAQGKIEEGAVWLDVRTAREFEESHLPGAINLPFGSLRYQAASLDPEKAYVVYCGDGQQSTTAAYLLVERGYETYVLERGLEGPAGLELSSDQASTSDNVVALRPESEVDRGEQLPSPEPLEAQAELQLLKKKLGGAEAHAREQLELMKKLKLALDNAKEKIINLERGKAATRTAYQQMEQESGTLKESLTELQGKLDQQAEDSLSEKAELEQRIVQLETALEASSSLQADLEDSRKSAESDLQRELKESTDKRVRLEQELAAGRDAMAKAEAQRKELESELEGLRASSSSALEDSQSRITELEQKLAQSDSEQGESQKQLGTLNAELENLKSTLDERGQELGSNQEKASALEQELEAVRSARQEQDQALEQRDAELKRQTEESESAQSRIVELEGELEAYKKEQALQQEQQDDEVRSRLGALESDLEMARQQATELESALESKNQQYNELQQQAEESKKQLEDRLAELSSDRDDLKQITGAELLGLQERIDQFAAEQEAQLKQQQELQQRSDQLEQDLDTANTRVEELEKALASDQEAGAATEQEHTAQLTQLESERDELRLRAESAEKQLETLGQEQQVPEQLAALEAELKQVQEARDQLQTQLEESAATVGREEDELSTLRLELEEAVKERDQARDELAEQQKLLSQKPSGDDELKILQAELDSLTDALEEADKAHDVMQRELDEAVAARTASDEALEQFKQALADGEESAGSEKTEQLQSDLEAEREARERAEGNSHRLQEEVDELRSVMEEYAAQIQQAQEGIEGEDMEALRLELDLVRQQAEADVKQANQKLQDAEAKLEALTAAEKQDEVAVLRLELQELQSRLRDATQGKSTEMAENEGLRQEVSGLEQAVEERQRQIDSMTKDLRRLEEKIEDSNSEVDRLKQALETAQVEAEEAEFRNAEELEARRQVEQALYKLQEQVEHERPEGMTDSQLVVDGKPLVFDDSGTGGRKGLMTGAGVGAVVAFVLAEIFSFVGGNGELVSSMLASDDPAPLASPVTPPRDVAPSPAVVQQAPKPEASTPQPERAVVKQPQQADAQTPDAATPRPAPQIAVAPSPVVSTPAVDAAPPRKQTGDLIQDTLQSGGSGPSMVYIRESDFTMGSDRSQLASEERPAHRVAVDAYAIGRYEVTFNEYQRFASATGRAIPDDLGWGRGSRPVINVNWEDAKAYTGWLSRQTGETYRLPTEAEWEFAARAGSDDLYWWGYGQPAGRANCFNCGSQYDSRTTAPVGAFEANSFGLHNTAGNVMEWVEDCYHGSYVNAPTDGSAWVEPGCRERVVRGGAFNKSADSLRSTKRAGHTPDAKLFVLGFRVVREVE